MEEAEFHTYMPALASYACQPAASRGRRFSEPESSNRTPYQRDRDRIIHSAAFRRLEYKTQVFVNHEGDHYRTRLTHTLEVSQLARSMARAMGLNEDLAEAIALAHDLGHPPFGHAGEEGLNEASKTFGGFDHNAHTLHILTRLEHRYAEFNGLNLSWETLEGIAKHNGPLQGKYATRVPSTRMKEIVETLAIDTHTYASAEAQIAAMADDIAYHNHDMDDGLRAELFTIDALKELPLVGETIREVCARYPELERQRLIHEFIRRVINSMVQDVLRQTARNIAEYKIQSVEDIRALNYPVVAFSPEMEEVNQSLKNFLMKNMYRHYKVNRMSSKAKRAVNDLFGFFLHEPECLPTAWRNQSDAPNTPQTALIVSDFIAGMTDRFASLEHARIFDLQARS